MISLFTDNISVPSNNASNPFGIDLGPGGAGDPRIRSRFIQSGPRIFDSLSDYSHSTVGLKGDFEDTGYTYDISVLTGGAFTNAFTQYHDTNAAGIQTNATGSSFAVTNSAGQTYLVYQTVLNTHGTQQLNLPPPNKANRVTWTQLR